MIRRTAALAALLLSGCVERLVAVRSEPPGATVTIDQEKVGETPCEAPYTWYGKRELVVELKGFRPVRETIVLNPPWWQFFPLDFLTDVLVPFTLRDRVEYSFTLQPAPVSADEIEEVRRRAAELREKAGLPK